MANWLLFQCLVVAGLSLAQIVLEELQQFNIDPLNLNGTEPYTDLTIDQIIARASGGYGSRNSLLSMYIVFTQS